MRGFTLVEVVVVLAVVLLLSGIAVPLISSYVEDGRRARAESEVKLLAGALANFSTDLGAFPTRDSGGRDNRVYSLFSGPTMPTSNPFTRGHNFASWAMNSTRGDLLNNHLLQNNPQGSTSAAYPTTGNVQWRGPYLAGSSPIDPWGRPYVINVISTFHNHATNYRRMFVLSAGANGQIDTDPRARAQDDLGGDDVGVLLEQR